MHKDNLQEILSQLSFTGKKVVLIVGILALKMKLNNKIACMVLHESSPRINTSRTPGAPIHKETTQNLAPNQF